MVTEPEVGNLNPPKTECPQKKKRNKARLPRKSHPSPLFHSTTRGKGNNTRREKCLLILKASKGGGDPATGVPGPKGHIKKKTCPLRTGVNTAAETSNLPDDPHATRVGGP